ncbi:unnamed protein product [Closterium sp. Naga37s-1]|nr:unnamed protein product [Closterium sp. Naga37s-1]
MLLQETQRAFGEGHELVAGLRVQLSQAYLEQGWHPGRVLPVLEKALEVRRGEDGRWRRLGDPEGCLSLLAQCEAALEAAKKLQSLMQEKDKAGSAEELSLSGWWRVWQAEELRKKELEGRRAAKCVDGEKGGDAAAAAGMVAQEMGETISVAQGMAETISVVGFDMHMLRAKVSSDMGDVDTAMQAYRTALALKEEALSDKDYRRVADSFHSAAKACLHHGWLDEAHSMATRALQLRETLLATVLSSLLSSPFPPHYFTPLYLANAHLTTIGQPEEAEKMSNRAMRVLESLPEAYKRSDEEATALSLLADHLQHTGRSAMALPLLERALSIQKEDPFNSFKSVGTAADLASLLLTHRGPREALPILLYAYFSLISFPGSSPTDLLRVLSLLSATLASLDQWDDAARVVGEMWELVTREGMEEALSTPERTDMKTMQMWLPLTEALGSEKRRTIQMSRPPLLPAHALLVTLLVRATTTVTIATPPLNFPLPPAAQGVFPVSPFCAFSVRAIVRLVRAVGPIRAAILPQSAGMHRVRNARASRLLHLFAQRHAAPRLGALQSRAGAVTAAGGDRPAALLVPSASQQVDSARPASRCGDIHVGRFADALPQICCQAVSQPFVATPSAEPSPSEATSSLTQRYRSAPRLTPLSRLSAPHHHPTPLTASSPYSRAFSAVSAGGSSSDSGGSGSDGGSGGSSSGSGGGKGEAAGGAISDQLSDFISDLNLDLGSEFGAELGSDSASDSGSEDVSVGVLEGVVEEARQAYGERHELVAGLRLRLAQAYMDQGRDAGEVLPVVEKAWEVSGGGAIWWGGLRLRLAQAYMDQGRDAGEVLSVVKKAWEVFDAVAMDGDPVFDAVAMDGDPVRAMCLHLTAACHARLGNPDECLSLLVQCEAALEAAKKLQSLMQDQDVAGTEQEIGSDGGESCGSRNGVAGVESGGGVGSRGGEDGRLEGGDGEGEGEEAAAAAAAMAQGTADAIHMVGFAMHMLRADVSSARGDMDTALKAYRTALELQEEALGSEDPRVADALQHVGEECARHMRLGDAHAMGMRALQLHEAHRRGLEERLGGEEGSGEGRGEEGGGVKGEELRERVREELEGRGREEVRREYEEAVMKEVADHRLLAAVHAGQGDPSPAVHHLSAAAALLSSLLSSPSPPSALSPLDLASVHLATVDIILHSGLLQGEEGGEMGEGGEEGGRVNREEMGGEEAEIAEESDSREQQGEGLGVGFGGGGVKGRYEGGAEGGEVREEAMDMAVLALEALKQCVAVQGEELGKDHPAVARTYALAADVYWQIGQAEEAEKVSKRAIKVLAAMPAAHQRSEEAAAALSHVALHLKRTDRCGMAVPLLQRALSIRNEHPDHLLQAVGSATDLASLLLSLRRPNEALPILLSALPSLRSFLGPSHTASLPLLSLLSAAHSSLDQWSEAAGVVGEMWEVVRGEGMEEAMGEAMRGDEAAIGMWIPLADALGSEERFLLLQQAVEQAARGAEAGGGSKQRGEAGEDAAAARARWLEVLREVTMIGSG